MSRYNGRDLVFTDSNDVVLGVATSKNFAIANNGVEVQGDDDAGYVTYLTRPSTSQITGEISFVFDDDASYVDLVSLALARNVMLTGFKIIFYDNADDVSPTALTTIEGDFYMSNVSITGASDGRIEGTASLASSGAWTETTA